MVARSEREMGGTFFGDFDLFRRAKNSRVAVCRADKQKQSLSCPNLYIGYRTIVSRDSPATLDITFAAEKLAHKSLDTSLVFQPVHDFGMIYDHPYKHAE